MEDRVYAPPKAPPTIGPAPQIAMSGPVGLGGWLILVIIGLVISPFRIGRFLITEHLPLFTDGTWEIITSADSPYYHVLWGPLLVFEVAGNLIMIVLSLTTLALILRKSRRVPKLIIGMYAFNIAFIVGDYILVNLIPAIAEQPDTETMTELIRALVGAAIWIPYFLVSKRVRNTFVR